MKILMRIKICLILVIILEIQSFLFLLIKKLLVKFKDEFKGTMISEFVGLKSKMYFFIAEDGEEIEKSRRKCCYKHKT